MVLLADKEVAVVERLQREGRMGATVYDAAELATSDLGVAMVTATDVAIETPDLTLVRGDLRAAVDAIRLSRRNPAHYPRATCPGPSPTTPPSYRSPHWVCSDPLIAGAALASLGCSWSPTVCDCAACRTSPHRPPLIRTQRRTM